MDMLVPQNSVGVTETSVITPLASGQAYYGL